MLEIYNSESRRKEPFTPIDPDGERVGMYYCGPTVYDSLHLGHARANIVVPDTMRRYLEYKGYVVRYVANFTDVDDKIIKRAIREKRSWREITFVYMEEYQRLSAAMGTRPVDVHPRATDHIPEMIDIVERLLEAGSAYVASNGDVYFDTASFDNYLALSGRNLEDQESGRSGRLSEAELEAKKQAADFILWKLSDNDPQLFRDHPEAVPAWKSPWGLGRPGWHLECSALSRTYLGMPFDIHGGGRDLLFPHHENERAQNQCAYCDELDGENSVRYWVHNGFVTVEAQTEAEINDEHTEGRASKMSKSLGNVKWLKDMIWPEGPFDPMALRLLLLQSHYRSPLHFSPALLDRAAARVEKIYGAVERLTDGLSGEDDEIAAEGDPSQDALDAVAQGIRDFEAGMDDDFNTARGLAAIDELLNAAKAFVDGPAGDRRAIVRGVESLAHILGLRVRRLGTPQTESAEDGLLQLLGEMRQEARAQKEWAQADLIRDRLAELGFEIRDSPAGFDVVRT
ncbi:MAG: cysteine--tRNA ligase [Acidobacteriota bacterium]